MEMLNARARLIGALPEQFTVTQLYDTISKLGIDARYVNLFLLITMGFIKYASGSYENAVYRIVKREG